VSKNIAYSKMRILFWDKPTSQFEKIPPLSFQKLHLRDYNVKVLLFFSQIERGEGELS